MIIREATLPASNNLDMGQQFQANEASYGAWIGYWEMSAELKSQIIRTSAVVTGGAAGTLVTLWALTATLFHAAWPMALILTAFVIAVERWVIKHHFGAIFTAGARANALGEAIAEGLVAIGYEWTQAASMIKMGWSDPAGAPSGTILWFWAEGKLGPDEYRLHLTPEGDHWRAQFEQIAPVGIGA
ncbi:hypothetical protein GCM10025867_51250 (plasmid) [Frondihabitans sucicola]|uniref:Uncharacterized protein n=1 Tax=Frondihabitans sucicola TaxID=1268041 RepID=A0ABN6Y750_9MICO|nr:hypothetical protein [Frondihabitans sucicola]BDZ52316.1 hypothetical protein GCM10025867_45570 [Frondihabitans sucicola]BDZ52884.1 hypothetical protein GCM10025867_51250 [Frondihabitans sucicola]